ncbi:tyrosinase [Streptomyces actinomycinicus]|uniref:Tyrosinase n=1 Tax=Streptomyces actinomycinicus TaxID=1695166 RepID=A0A937JIR6_9ACTN|nr:tyrosinase family oxidase copper chaperone [Streptomyces actinomycinicus]MBL1080604.1 tyrosinase [Streptomyces actinomycinicus]
MVVGVGGAPVGAEQQARAGAAGPSRREVARGLVASAAAVALAPLVAASRPVPPADGLVGNSFDEVYRGRRIQGALVSAEGAVAARRDWRITVDGRPLHLMRRADGGWLSMADHYTSYRTPLEATRAAVDQIGPGQRLRDLAPGPVGGVQGVPGAQGVPGVQGGHMHMGGRHGVRA